MTSERRQEVAEGTYSAHRGRERGPPSRNPQRSVRCWTWWRWPRRPHSGRTPAWKAPKESRRDVDRTFRKAEAERRWLQRLRAEMLTQTGQTSWCQGSLGQRAGVTAQAWASHYTVSMVTESCTGFPVAQVFSHYFPLVNWVSVMSWQPFYSLLQINCINISHFLEYFQDQFILLQTLLQSINIHLQILFYSWVIHWFLHLIPFFPDFLSVKVRPEKVCWVKILQHTVNVCKYAYFYCYLYLY